ncbi:hypothetical protein [Helicobacter cetorum]|uniref:hypothetical protein n=1 Tax=Helicobacter cetorum TaxID=138563 RepID=UPI000CF123F8|nr:hypothetical protein [Helicobacter cetorum]
MNVIGHVKGRSCSSNVFIYKDTDNAIKDALVKAEQKGLKKGDFFSNVRIYSESGYDLGTCIAFEGNLVELKSNQVSKQSNIKE